MTTTGKIVLDTDIMVDFLRGHPAAVEFVKANSERILLSCVVVAELYAGVRDQREEAVLDELVSFFQNLPVTAALAKAGGLNKRNFGRSHGTGLADGIIAATAQAEGAVLQTLNTRHYPMFHSIVPPYTKNN